MPTMAEPDEIQKLTIESPSISFELRYKKGAGEPFAEILITYLRQFAESRRKAHEFEAEAREVRLHDELRNARAESQH